ncbi:MAG: Gfo/Idh/MocA family oxidoreductase [Bryobacteraceae bacterium]
MHRRNFIRTAAITAASYSRIFGANNRLGMALIGGGRRGREVMMALLGTKSVDLVSVCDIYDNHRALAAQALGKPGHECAAHEESLARRDVDAVLVATADHWHRDIALDSIKAHKHLYLEKPIVHHFEETNSLYRAAKLSDKVVFVGTQQRSGAHYQQAKEEIFDRNRLGKVLLVRASWSDFGWQARNVRNEPKPPGLDWVRFLGRTPYHDYEKARYDSWRIYPEYGGGVLADILNHWADVAQWMMSDSVPLDAVTSGGIYLAKDGRTNPDTVNAILRYSKGWNLAFESTIWPVENPRPSVEFLGTEGTLDIARSDYVFRPSKGQPVQVKASGGLEAAHAANFVAACLTGSKPSADITIGVEGLLPCHLARAAYWSGRRAVYHADRNEISTS